MFVSIDGGDVAAGSLRIERLSTRGSMVGSWEESATVTVGTEPLDRLRVICIALPEAVETGGVGAPSFKVRGKIFVMRYRQGGRWSMWCKARPGVQQVLADADPTRFFVPPYVGHHGWVGVYLDVALDWDEITDLVDDSYRMTAPKRLSRLLAVTWQAPSWPSPTCSSFDRRAISREFAVARMPLAQSIYSPQG